MYHHVPEHECLFRVDSSDVRQNYTALKGLAILYCLPTRSPCTVGRSVSGELAVILWVAITPWRGQCL